jgi:hypothetical protein
MDGPDRVIIQDEKGQYHQVLKDRIREVRPAK